MEEVPLDVCAAREWECNWTSMRYRNSCRTGTRFY